MMTVPQSTPRRILALLLVLPVVAGLLVIGGGAAVAHECWDRDDPPPDYEQNRDIYWQDGDQVCRETWVVPNWRENYSPVFGLENRHDTEQRKDAQRWRNECSDHHANTYEQMCMWNYGGFSVFENQGDGEYAPNRWHAGFAANHCFLFEAAHQCEDHPTGHGEGVHDAHGGAIYVDVCLTRDTESRYCQRGLEDTRAGVTILDHLGCVPAGCVDEYIVVRPFDTWYTQRQLENSGGEIQRNLADPGRYVCGHHANGRDCRDNFSSTRPMTYDAMGYQRDQSGLERACSNSPKAGFEDIEGNEHEHAIHCAAWWEVITELPRRGATEYGPDELVTRDHLASFLAAMIDRSEGQRLATWDGKRRFRDVRPNSPHAAAVHRLVDAGILEPVDDRTFGAEQPVRRDALATYLARSMEFVTRAERTTDQAWFEDVDEDNPHREHVNAMHGYELGIMHGDGQLFHPERLVHRDTLAAAVMGVLNVHVEEAFANPPSARYGAHGG